MNSRVAKYDKNGDWVKSWGEKGTAPGQFRLPHSIVIDRNGARSEVFLPADGGTPTIYVR